MSVETDRGPNGFRLHLMPSWELWSNDRSIEVSLRQQRLLAFLAVQGTSRRELVAGMLWPESPEHCALDNLRVSIHKVSSELPELIRVDRHALGLAPHVWVDLKQEWEVLGTTQTHESLRSSGTESLLLGWYEDWVIDEQARLQQARITYWHRVALTALACCDYSAAVESAVQGLYLDVLDETSLEIMVVAHLGLGQCISALKAIVGFRRRASHELGIAGSPALDRLEARVRLVARTPILSCAGEMPDYGSITRWPGGHSLGVA